jgi:hypothetical protein
MPGRFTPLRLLRGRRLLLAICAVALLGVGAVSARAASSIEAIWSFNGGEIAVHPLPGGEFTGTVVAATKFAECSHPVGQEIWTGLRLQPDGSYWGSHAWYESPGCMIDPTPGPTTFRVQRAQDGSHYLRACFSTPGSTQPRLPADGSEADVTYGCVNSARIAALPISHALAFRSLVTLPGSKKCFSRRSFQIHIRDPSHDPFTTVIIMLVKHRIPVTRRGHFIVATVNLRHLPRGTFTIRIRATTVLGRHLIGHRTYHTCRKKHLTRAKHHRKSR